MKILIKVTASMALLGIAWGLGFLRLHGEDLAIAAGGPIYGGMLVEDAASWFVVMVFAAMVALWIPNDYVRGLVLIVGAVLSMSQTFTPSERVFMHESQARALDIGDRDAFAPMATSMEMGAMAEAEMKMMQSIADTGDLVVDLASQVSRRNVRAIADQAERKFGNPVGAALNRVLDSRPVYRSVSPDAWNDLRQDDADYMPATHVGVLGSVPYQVGRLPHAPGNLRTATLRSLMPPGVLAFLIIALLVALGSWLPRQDQDISETQAGAPR